MCGAGDQGSAVLCRPEQLVCAVWLSERRQLAQHGAASWRPPVHPDPQTIHLTGVARRFTATLWFQAALTDYPSVILPA